MVIIIFETWKKEEREKYQINYKSSNTHIFDAIQIDLRLETKFATIQVSVDICRNSQLNRNFQRTVSIQQL